MSNVETINLTAKEFAKNLHNDDNWGTKPYTEHLELVVKSATEINNVLFDGRFNNETITNVAYLHDTIEDYPNMDNEIKDLFTNEYEAIKLLTRKSEDTYLEYIESIANSGNEVAIIVKVADLNVNKGNLPSGDSLGVRYDRALSILYPVLRSYND